MVIYENVEIKKSKITKSVNCFWPTAFPSETSLDAQSVLSRDSRNVGSSLGTNFERLENECVVTELDLA